MAYDVKIEKYEKSIATAKAEANLEIERATARIQADIELKKAEVRQMLDEKLAQNTRTLAIERAETMRAIDEVSLRSAALIMQKLGLTEIFEKDEKDVQSE